MHSSIHTQDTFTWAWNHLKAALDPHGNLLTSKEMALTWLLPWRIPERALDPRFCRTTFSAHLNKMVLWHPTAGYDWISFVRPSLSSMVQLKLSLPREWALKFQFKHHWASQLQDQILFHWLTFFPWGRTPKEGNWDLRIWTVPPFPTWHGFLFVIGADVSRLVWSEGDQFIAFRRE